MLSWDDACMSVKNLLVKQKETLTQKPKLVNLISSLGSGDGNLDVLQIN